MEVLTVAKFVSEPALDHEHLAGFLGRFLDADLRLLLGAHEQNFSALADSSGEEIQGCFELRLGLAQINDMNSVARVEDERLHLGVPTLRLMSKMDAGIQQFFYADSAHNFPLVITPDLPEHPAETGF